jgi:cation diffusion facilitator family transporter
MPYTAGMHTETIEPFRHDHDHVMAGHHESRTRWVVLITAAMMVVELVIGTLTHSMALTADGWHMATHAGALGMSALAYWFARTRSRAESFSFGTGKVYALAGYTSAVVLGIVALLMFGESVRRLLRPEAIHFSEALPVAIVGLLVNLASVKLLDADHHDEEAGHDHDHGDHHHHHHDHNLRAAYFHVLADAFTSVLAIAALVGGRYAGWTFLDPLMGIVGGAVILRWSIGLCRGAARQLLDMVSSPELAQTIRQKLEVGDVKIADLHLWDLAPGRRGCIVSLVTEAPQDTAVYRSMLDGVEGIAHLTVEVRRCPGHESAAC